MIKNLFGAVKKQRPDVRSSVVFILKSVLAFRFPAKPRNQFEYSQPIEFASTLRSLRRREIAENSRFSSRLPSAVPNCFSRSFSGNFNWKFTTFLPHKRRNSFLIIEMINHNSSHDEYCYNFSTRNSS